MTDISSLGWFLCPMDSGSKNPGSILGKEWPSKCSNDPAVIASWPAGCNLGVLLGSKSGIIDLEFDSEIGEQFVDSWLEDCGNPPTPTYRSAKSVHRLFKWEDRFELEGAKFGHMGVEFRFGCNAAQSVIPPSLHESGVRYEWIIPPWECEVATLPELIYKAFLSFKTSAEKKIAKAVVVDPRYTSGDSLLTKARNHVEQTHAWESILVADGWKFCRNRNDAQDWWRPGKTKGSISGTVNFGGSKTLRVFTTETNLKPDSSYDKFSYLCLTQYHDDPVKAAFGLCPEDVLGRKNQTEVDFSKLNVDGDEPQTIEEFMESMIPQEGLIRSVYEYYRNVSQFPAAVMGLATALSFCQTIFGRRIRSQTDLRTNDYNVVMAPTGGGKEACETATLKLFEAVGYDLTHPPDVQSGNGLLAAMVEKPCGIWVCDEFGKMLESIINPASNPHMKNIGTHVLKMYGKAGTNYGGAAHAAGVRNKIQQPHLCILGLTTPRVLNTITAKEVDEGLMGRLAFFVCQDRPKSRIVPMEEPNEHMVAQIRQWIEWAPMSGGNLSDKPTPATLMMATDAWERWRGHQTEIRDRMDSEGELRAAVWVRVAARTMKLAMTHRAARLREDPGQTEWTCIQIEMQDINWAVKLSNNLAETSCNLLLDGIVDEQKRHAQDRILAGIAAKGSISLGMIANKHQKITVAQFRAAGISLADAGLIQIEKIKPQGGGRTKEVYSKKIELPPDESN